ncbi:general odorant-binding protein 70 [Aricia agestis]|uniref:general odorant-binding protein 70 n=1 Tax=Aricia agestis TaxID=91739 RepID=UPI001C209315|nr:general odorant-binding protein 70 [Aricia agestis]
MVRQIGVLLCCFAVFGISLSEALSENKTRCRNPPTAPQKIERVITLCQDEIKVSILREALDVIKEEHTMPAERTRNKREVPFTHDEKRIAGCLLQCVYRKVKAVDTYGFPTLEGLVGLYSDGVNERGYFMAVLEASRECLMQNHDKFSRTVPMDNGRNCDVSFNIFECISDRIGEYCGNAGL